VSHENEASREDNNLGGMSCGVAGSCREDHCDDENTTKKEEEQRKFQKELVEERVFNQLDGAIKQVKNIREMSQTGSMSDDERRKRAGDAAMLLMDIMGQLDCDDDDEDDSSVHDEGGQNKEDTQEQVAA